jgi:hypothetical protein
LQADLPLFNFKVQLPRTFIEAMYGGRYIYWGFMLSIIAEFSAAFAKTFYITQDSTAYKK